jgi:hypothetical protein
MAVMVRYIGSLRLAGEKNLPWIKPTFHDCDGISANQNAFNVFEFKYLLSSCTFCKLRSLAFLKEHHFSIGFREDLLMRGYFKSHDLYNEEKRFDIIIQHLLSGNLTQGSF